ncbi:MAG: hypothetical protein AVDCRST_MAG95-2770 [uncultured Adhaeribacter sp.]|uniref:Uncharacterized protein n=1 Tax=uncultured Adhaeribacter sp. TaxID=448109 RepID=A0A6J4JAE3_9BACT|nr:MAG: hypothetical protein AVDCRST_MAG95-2770 [uncultured Adhaeribacter sp.]
MNARRKSVNGVLVTCNLAVKYTPTLQTRKQNRRAGAFYAL